MRAVSISALVIALGATSAGCSIWNAPNRGLLDGGSDGGVDAWVDEPDAWVDPGDAGVDTGVDANVCTPTRELCGDGRDQDCDGLVDCADPQCIASGAAECCDATHTERLDEDFGGGALVNWQRDGTAPIVADGAIVAFGSAGVIGMVRQRTASVPACLAVELGTRVEATMQAISCTGSACEGFAQIVLGPSSRYRAGTRLTTDLGVRGTTHDGSLTIELLEGTRVVHTWADLGATPQTVVVELGLGVSGGVPAIVAQVGINDGSTPVSDVHVVDRSHVDIGVCDGLFLGIEGTGNDVRVDDVNVTQRDCSNPSRMDPVGVDTPPLDALTFSAEAWAGGGIGDPAIFAGTPTSDDTWFVLFDGSTDDRATESLHTLPLAIGGGDSTRMVSGQLALSRACPDWTPRSGIYFSGCEGDEGTPLTNAIPSQRAMRDPTLYADSRRSQGFTSLRVVWAGERSATDPTTRLYAGALDLGSPTTQQLTVGAELEIDGETCERLRSPLLLPLVGSAADWMLLYVCDVFPSEVHGAVGNFIDGFVREPSILIGADELGSLAANGVRDLAGVVFSYDSGATPTYRLWLVTSSKREGLVVVFVEGTASSGEVPSFVPYPGNPVLTATDPALPPCAGTHCEIHGIAATRLPSSPTSVRLLVERWEDTGTATTYSLLPLAQTWRSDLP